MTIPSSVVIGILVLAWLYMLVPMVARRHDPVYESEEGAHFRVLRPGALRARMKRGRGWVPTDRDHDDTAADLVEDTDPQYADLDDADLDDADFVDDAGDEEFTENADRETVPAIRAARSDLDSDRDGRFARVDTDDDHDDRGAAEYEDEDTFEDDRSEVHASDRGARYRDEEYAEPTRIEAAYRPEAQSHRLGRGGYDPEANEMARAYRYAQRQRVTLVLLIATVACAGAAYFALSALWAGAGVFGGLLVLYLAYLRRQVTIEEDIRQRRQARLQRARQIRPEEHYRRDAHYEPDPAQVPDAVIHRRGRVVLDLDDDDPGFDDLEYYAPVEYRRASGQ